MLYPQEGSNTVKGRPQQGDRNPGIQTQTHLRCDDIQRPGHQTGSTFHTPEPLNRSIQHSYQHFKHVIHKHENKCGRLLANLLKQRKTQLYIPKIKGLQQQHLHLLDQILSAFHTYYQDAPGEPCPSRLEGIQKYLESANVTTLEDNDREGLETSISTEELTHAIKRVKTGKARPEIVSSPQFHPGRGHTNCPVHIGEYHSSS
ncbi:Hypothetical predicted protein [Pelobates cultripes]|uniref:Uncharacterized protein n=1 Tax=Pelobates cultripes TaxID=61616 RepID=A0AAD1REG6_PELCU|nr:Hypothetical predicted protein [Pelobates cultripes]